MWKRHVVYESRPHSVIVTLGGKLYRIPETVAPNKVLQGRKISSHIRKLFTSQLHLKENIRLPPHPQHMVSLLIKHKKKIESLIPHPSEYLYNLIPCIQGAPPKKIIHTAITTLLGCQRKEASSLQQMSHQNINSAHSSIYKMRFNEMDSISS